MKKLLEGKKIFIVEDDPLNLRMLCACMLDHGARIESNVLGFDIIEHIMDSLPVDLIILDIMLRKNLLGYDVLEKIRASKSIKDIPVVVVTSSDWEVALPRAKAKGANGFISKPFNLVEFPQHISLVLSGEQIWVT